MTLNHLNLAVPDVPAAAAFFAKYFGLHLLEGKGQPSLIAIMEDDAGFVLILSNFPQAAARSLTRRIPKSAFTKKRSSR